MQPEGDRHDPKQKPARSREGARQQTNQRQGDQEHQRQSQHHQRRRQQPGAPLPQHVAGVEGVELPPLQPPKRGYAPENLPECPQRILGDEAAHRLHPGLMPRHIVMDGKEVKRGLWPNHPRGRGMISQIEHITE